MRDKEYTLKKEKGIYRIVVLGDSITMYGYYTDFLEESLIELGLDEDKLVHIEAVLISYEVIRSHLLILKKYLEKPGYSLSSFNLSRMFFASLKRSDIYEYRKYLLDQLTKLGKTGERIWEDIIDLTERTEQYPFARARHKKYPRELKEAMEVYGKI